MDSKKENVKMNDLESELSEDELEMVIGGIMSEIVIRETMKNVNNFGNKIDQINEKVKKEQY